MSRLITTLNYVEFSDLAVNRWHLPNDVDLRHKALCAKKVNDVNIRQTAPNVLSLQKYGKIPIKLLKCLVIINQNNQFFSIGWFTFLFNTDFF